jgi:Skp family chaperone for outer membrane proteins
MNRNIRQLIAVLVLVACGTFATQAQDRIATVDLREVFDGYWKTKQANDALQERGEELDAELKTLVADFTTAREEYQAMLESANDPNVASGERERRREKADEKMKELQDDQQMIQQFERQAGETIREQNARVRDNILEEITAVVTSLARAGEFNLVLDIAAETSNRTKVVLYSNNPNDLTEDVLKQLNATAPPDLEQDSDE